ncbi:IS30 family transposase, partial [Patescibacteria group bacterium]|nr:IS30 family transposase [Patescibacteria group bacterium]
MKHYKHLSASDREEVSRGLAQGKPLRSIAKELQRSPSSVSREIRRNTRPKTGMYRAVSAERSAKKRRKTPRRQRMLIPGNWLWDTVVKLLHLKWSPDQIAEHLKETYPQDMEKHISHEAIYQAIYVLPRGTLRTELTDCLRRSHRHRRKRRYLREERRGQIPDMVSIHDRPAEVESREIPGHWEGDLIVGKYNTSAIGTLVERLSRKILICKLGGRTSEDV